VWSLGISLIELALGRFPFSESASDDDSDLSEFEGTLSPSRPVLLEKKKKGDIKDKKRDRRKSKGVSLQGGGMTMSILELLQHIVNEPAPKLTPEGRFPKEAEVFVNSCLLKEPDHRRTPKDLLVSGLAGFPKIVLFWAAKLWGCPLFSTESRVDQTCANSTL
jgi:mitogen-activated protein kinase kinase